MKILKTVRVISFDEYLFGRKQGTPIIVHFKDDAPPKRTWFWDTTKNNDGSEQLVFINDMSRDSIEKIQERIPYEYPEENKINESKVDFIEEITEYEWVLKE